jgi:hypothetical protein
VIASAIRGSPSSPSISTSSEQPSRGGGSPAAHSDPSCGGENDADCPMRASRLR